jgi:hypothetical protein
MEQNKNLTYGEKAVGLTFNPSGNSEVENIKKLFALQIDALDNLRQTSTLPEQKRLASIAITEIQSAQMWAVKAITWQD